MQPEGAAHLPPDSGKWPPYIRAEGGQVKPV